MEVQDLARLLATSGSRFTSEVSVRADIDAGAPVNADGTINLVRYAAWLARNTELAEPERGD